MTPQTHISTSISTSTTTPKKVINTHPNKCQNKSNRRRPYWYTFRIIISMFLTFLLGCYSDFGNDFIFHHFYQHSPDVCYPSPEQTLLGNYCNITSSISNTQPVSPQPQIYLRNKTTTPRMNTKSIYIPGSGFSGFWFTLGQMFSLSHPSTSSSSSVINNEIYEYEYYCFSAGCLALIASLFPPMPYNDHNSGDRGIAANDIYSSMANNPNHQMDGRMKSRLYVMDLAFGLQSKWSQNHISRYDLLTDFVEGLLPTKETTSTQHNNNQRRYRGRRRRDRHEKDSELDSRILQRIHILTTTNMYRPMIQQPQNKEHLKDLLVQTSWIPYATGSSLWKKDMRKGTLHMDGGFTALLHPKCHYNLYLPKSMPSLFLNTLNPGINRNQVERYFQAGLKQGYKVFQ